MKKGLKQIALSLIAIQLVTMPGLSSAYANGGVGPDPENAGCAYSENYPCTDIFAGKIEDREGHAAQYCKQMKGNDVACDFTWPLATGYTAVAITCASACFGGPFTAYMEPACEIGSLAASGADFIAGFIAKNEIEKHTQNSEAIIAQDWGFALPAIGFAANTTAIGITAVSAGSLGYAFGIGNAPGQAATAASQAVTPANAAAKSAATDMVQANDKLAETSKALEKTDASYIKSPTGEAQDAADTAHSQYAAAKDKADSAKQNYDKVQANADDKASKSTDAKSKAEKAKKKKKLASCLAFGINTAMAAIKWYNFFEIKKNSREQWDNLCNMGTPGCVRPAPLPSAAPGLASINSKSPGGGVSGGNAPAAPTAGGTGNSGLEQKADKAATGGKIGQAFASAGGALPKPSTDGVNKALDAIYKSSGVTPGKLAANVEKAGLAATMGAFLPASAGDILKKIEDDAKNMAGKTDPVQFASASQSGNRSPSSGSSSMFGGGAAAPTDAGASLVKFGGFSGDIWHAGTNKSLFEIISDKTKAVSGRVQH